MEIKIYQPLFIHEQGKRDNQEDALWNEGATALDSLFIVCDGMGGHEKGEVASQTFSQALGKWFAEHVDSRQPLADAQLSNAITYAYDELDKQDDGNSIKKMGTTLTLLYIHAHGVTAAHIGDSRIYHIRPGYYTADHPEKAILYQSRDDSLVYELYQTGEISYEEMATHPQKNVITKAVTPAGRREDPSIIHITDIKPGDYFYMCSDGMLEKMSNAELATLFSSGDTDEKKRKDLIEATKENADNHTAWIIRVKEVQLLPDDPTGNEELTSKFNALNMKPKQQEPKVQIVEGNDVEVVAAPTRPNPKVRRVVCPNPKKEKSSLFSWLKKWEKLAALVIAASCILITLIYFYTRSTKDEKENQHFTDHISVPTISYNENQHTVTITTGDKGVTIRYSTDGKDPVNGLKYTEPFMWTSVATIKAVAIKNGKCSKEAQKKVYPKPDKPKIIPQVNNLIVIKAPSEDCEVWYKINDGEYQLYKEQIRVDSTMRAITAKAVRKDDPKLESEENTYHNNNNE